MTRTWTATDACGNTSTASQTITVHDTTAPVIAASAGPEHDRVPGDAGVRGRRRRPTPATRTSTLTFADVTTPGTCAGEYSVTRTWTATDACGNTSTASQTITVKDTTAAGDRGSAGPEHDRVPGHAGVRDRRRRPTPATRRRR